MLGCRIRLREEASQTTPLTPTSQFSRSYGPVEVINPAGTQQGWARWKSSAHDDIEAIRYTFGSVQPPPKLISAKGDLLNNLGWPELLKGLVQCQGNLEETLLRMRDDLDQEIKTSAVENPITIAKLSRLEKILLELEEKAKVQAPRLGMGVRDLILSSTPEKAAVNNRSDHLESPLTLVPASPASGLAHQWSRNSWREL
jgi:hypothetical protein